MTAILFYEKPGCINNTKQKALLQAAGHTVEAHNLLQEPWTPERLRPFFGNRPVEQWFNVTAPAIKSGAVNPADLDEARALALMMQDPLLIRRPLMQVGDRCESGFDTEAIHRWIGLNPTHPDQQQTCADLIRQDLQTCPNTHSGANPG